MTSPRVTLAVGLLLAVNAVLLSVPAMEMPGLEPPCAFQKAILCAELPRDGAMLSAVLEDPANPLARWRRQVWLDFPFLVLYASLLALVALRDARRSARPAWGWFAAGLLALGAMLDAVENAGILTAVGHLEGGRPITDALATQVRMAASAKFLVLALGSALGLGLAWPTVRHPLNRLGIGIGIALCAAALGGLVEPQMLEVGALGIVIACLVALLRSIAAVVRRPAQPPTSP